MIARMAFLSFLILGCVSGTYLGENMSKLSGSEGIMISGGYSVYSGYSVEVFVPSTSQACSLPDLPDARYGHTSSYYDYLIICGGEESSTNCITFGSGRWVTKATLREERYGSSGWQTDRGLQLMGGEGSPASSDSSEYVKLDREQGPPSFDMQYSTYAACSMPDLSSDSVIVTGGSETMSTVSRYGFLGWVEDLPSLVVGRDGHGCGSFIGGDGTQVLLIAGGVDDYGNYLSSTEMLTTDSPGWTLTTPLPRAVDGARGVSLGGRLYMTGGEDADEILRDEILVWMNEEQEWQETGKMKMARSNHAVNTIPMDDEAMEYCV